MSQPERGAARATISRRIPLPRKKLSIAAQPPKREPEIIKAEIARLETLARKSYGKPGLSARWDEIMARLEECKAELEAANG